MDDALDAYLAAVTAAEPAPLVKHAVRQGLLDTLLGDRERPDTLHVLGLGKAAPGMVWGLVESQFPVTGLGVVPHGIKVPTIEGFAWMAGEHPVPGAGSRAAAEAALAWADALPEDAPVVVCLSGGASACCEDNPHPDWEAMLAGMDIVTMNQHRAKTSSIKGGKLATRVLERTRRVIVLVLSDVPPEHPEAVGAGPMWHPDIPHHVLADCSLLVQHAGLRLGAAGYNVFAHRRVAGSVEEEAAAFAAALASLDAPAALVAAGEPIVQVPEGAPRGGRAAHAALAVAGCLEEGLVLCGASDGVDGDGESGAWATSDDANAQALQDGAAFIHLEARGKTFDIGPSGTNLGDIWIGLRS